jgi:hypothetical protein
MRTLFCLLLGASGLLAECSNFAGTWQATSELSAMEISQDGCNLQGKYTSGRGAIHYELSGPATGDAASLSVVRMDQRGCRTFLHGTFTREANGTITSKVAVIAASCGVDTNHAEVRSWHLLPKP